MKTLTLSALLCAMMALTRAAALPDAEDEPGTEGTAVQEAGNWTDSFTPGESHTDKRSVSCPSGWTAFNDRCFLYVPRSTSWAVAERNCMSMGGHLASVHNIQEYHQIQTLISSATHYQGLTWIGGSDGQQEYYWFWSDGTSFDFSQWCPGEPNNYLGHQNCAVVNHSDQKCWDDVWCDWQLPSVCVRNG
ncbi:type-2 ice-structuring protein-like isoform X2 [Micropterus salmoides]|uniref:type-2 ice-structuring protein-like isoform X2 n=1 Tax=Micropterus salmoides TaxID=27706 RepID=UPI0018EC07FD|nr:type-2 ice-structuring protein-like isoform X2 [Micropterus salmoides]